MSNSNSNRKNIYASSARLVNAKRGPRPTRRSSLSVNGSNFSAFYRRAERIADRYNKLQAAFPSEKTMRRFFGGGGYELRRNNNNSRPRVAMKPMKPQRIDNGAPKPRNKSPNVLRTPVVNLRRVSRRPPSVMHRIVGKKRAETSSRGY